MDQQEIKQSTNNNEGEIYIKQDSLDYQQPELSKDPDNQWFCMRSKAFDALTAKEKAQQLFGNNKRILAPMVRASTTPLRVLAIKYGADVVYSEEMVDRSILTCHRILNPKLGTIDYLRDKSEMSTKQLRKMRKNTLNPSLEIDNLNLPVVLRLFPAVERDKFVYQMGTGEPNLALEAALKVQHDVCGIDINMGCPKKFSVSGGMGQALLEDAKRACSIISILKQHLPHLPISAKIRFLPTPTQTISFVNALQQAGVDAIAIHARYAGQDPSDTLAQWDQLAPVIASISVPTIINGDLFTQDEIQSVRLSTGSDSVMLARPAFYNLSLFSSTKTSARVPQHQVIQDFLKYALQFQANYQNAKYVVCEMLSQRRVHVSKLPKLDFKLDAPFKDHNIGLVCQQKNLENLCKLWKVDFINQAPVDFVPTDQVYDDRYFLDPQGLKNDRESQQHEHPSKRIKAS